MILYAQPHNIPPRKVACRTRAFYAGRFFERGFLNRLRPPPSFLFIRFWTVQRRIRLACPVSGALKLLLTIFPAISAKVASAGNLTVAWWRHHNHLWNIQRHRPVPRTHWACGEAPHGGRLLDLVRSPTTGSQETSKQKVRQAHEGTMQQDISQQTRPESNPP